MWRQLDLLHTHNSSNKEKNENMDMSEELKINSNCKVKGSLKLYAFPADLVPDYETNIIDYAGVGTGSPSSTALGTEVGTRVAISYHYAINNEYHLDTFYGKNDPNTSSNILTEAGLFSASSSGDMYCSKTISFTKTTSVTLLLAWYWSFT